ncbi:very short patch repair endonuclease [Lysobacter arenosi]|nr:very short patch repair endonuclease [Lysobacter arenosi]
MRAIRARDTKPELAVRKILHRLGFRFRLHVRALPGTPDIVFPKHKAVILVHGCFWHGHRCHMFKVPGTRTDFWLSKISANQKRDRAALLALAAAGWRVLTIWECALKGPTRLTPEDLAQLSASWLLSDAPTCELGPDGLREEYGSSDPASEVQ